MQYLKCQNCGLVFESPIQISGSSFTLQGNYIPCPRCHRNVNTDGIYTTDSEGNVINYNGQPTSFASKVLNFFVNRRISIEELESLRNSLYRLQEEGASRAAVVSAIEDVSPNLFSLGRGVPSSPSDLKSFIIILLLLINILLSRGVDADNIESILDEFNSQITQHSIYSPQQQFTNGKVINVTINIVNNKYINEAKIDRYIGVLQQIVSEKLSSRQAKELINLKEPELSPISKYLPQPSDIIGAIILPLLIAYKEELTGLFRRRRRGEGPLTKEELKILRETVLSNANKE
ncbi:hypothetical protein DAERI_130088 [Deinococcus aerius]|uniref:Uncharacterized protein n=1 Tax=Deinococcus aerius TaxID=200253 RepID=A0A2I9DLB9_9DEIO|nr:hypothetical protein [Deinococcus aerius]GBF07258.1 hypothetical protein DAERI_130088 [Deinococcus aerius]